MPTFPSKELINQIAEALCLETVPAKNFLVHVLTNAVIVDEKQKDYGSGNIAAFGTFGVIVRMNDKMERIKNLWGKGIQPANEAIVDSFRDIANYAIIGLMLENGEWPDK